MSSAELIIPSVSMLKLTPPLPSHLAHVGFTFYLVTLVLLLTIGSLQNLRVSLKELVCVCVALQESLLNLDSTELLIELAITY